MIRKKNHSLNIFRCITPENRDGALWKHYYNTELVNNRKKFRELMQKYNVPGSYVDVNELEADQYAANKVGKDAMIRALRSMDSLDKKYEEMDIKNGLVKKNKRQYNKLHKRHLVDTKIRIDALNDDNIEMELRKSLSD